MFKYVAKKEVADYKTYCQNVLSQLQEKLKKEYSIVSAVTVMETEDIFWKISYFWNCLEGTDWLIQ